MEEFLEEAAFMKHYTHANILKPLGVVWRDGDRPQVVLPYMSQGDLCSLVRKSDMVSTSHIHSATIKNFSSLYKHTGCFRSRLHSHVSFARISPHFRYCGLRA